MDNNIDYTGIANRLQQMLGVGVMPSTIKVVVGPEVLALAERLEAAEALIETLTSRAESAEHGNALLDEANEQLHAHGTDMYARLAVAEADAARYQHVLSAYLNMKTSKTERFLDALNLPDDNVCASLSGLIDTARAGEER